MISQMGLNENDNWAFSELGDVKLADERLTNRLIKIVDHLSRSPESSINQACGDWLQLHKRV